MHTESDGLKQKIFSAFANKLLFSCHLISEEYANHEKCPYKQSLNVIDII